MKKMIMKIDVLEIRRAKVDVVLEHYPEELRNPSGVLQVEMENADYVDYLDSLGASRDILIQILNDDLSVICSDKLHGGENE